MKTRRGSEAAATLRADSMTTTLLDGTATGVDVYVGQSTAVIGAVLIGAGVIGVLLTLAVAAVATLRPYPAPEIVEAVDPAADSEENDLTPDAPQSEPEITRPEADAETDRVG